MVIDRKVSISRCLWLMEPPTIWINKKVKLVSDYILSGYVHHILISTVSVIWYQSFWICCEWQMKYYCIWLKLHNDALQGYYEEGAATNASTIHRIPKATICNTDSSPRYKGRKIKSHWCSSQSHKIYTMAEDVATNDGWRHCRETKLGMRSSLSATTTSPWIVKHRLAQINAQRTK